MKKLFIFSSFIVLLLNIASCSASKKYSSKVIEEYKKYDESFSLKDYKIEKVEELKGREDDFIRGFDASLVSHLQESGVKYYNFKYEEEPLFKILKDNNVNTLRFRLFHNYKSINGCKAGKLDLENVNKMIKEAKKYDFKILLDLHYSDYWSDPSRQDAPEEWKNKSFTEVKECVYSYTKEVIEYIISEGSNIDYIQIGNEVNNGLIYPFGQIDWSSEKTKEEGLDRVSELLKQGIKASKEISPSTKIIIHSADALKTYEEGNSTKANGLWFFDQMEKRNVDYDIIGSSFYSFQTKDTKVESITLSINQLSDKFSKPVIVVENSYGYTTKSPFNSLNELTSKNKVKEYDLTIQGQTNNMVDCIKAISKASNKNGAGYFYWGGEWVVSQNNDLKSNWANQALFTFDGVALPSLKVFKEVF